MGSTSYQPDTDYIVSTVNATVVRVRRKVQGGAPSGGLEDGVDIGYVLGNPNGQIIGYLGDVRFQADNPTLWFKFNAALNGTDQGWVALDSGNFAAAIAALQAAVAAIQAQLVVMQAQLDANTAAILVLQGQVAVIQGQIATLQAQVATLQTQIAAPFLTVGGSGLLASERAINPIGGLGFTDNGPNGTYDIFIAPNGVTNTMLAQMAANTVKANPTGALANAQDFPIGTNSVLGRVAGNMVAAQAVTDQIGDNQITNAKLAQAPAASIKGNPLAIVGNEQDVVSSAPGQVPTAQADGTWAWSAPSDVFEVSTPGPDNWPIPTGFTFARVVLHGGGGGGGSGASISTAGQYRSPGAGGGAGARMIKTYRIVDLIAAYGASVPFVIGAGGPGALGVILNATGNDGSPGTTSSFATNELALIAFGGGGGRGGSANSARAGGGGAGTGGAGSTGAGSAAVAGGAPGAGTGNSITTLPGGTGGFGNNGVTDATSNGQSSEYGSGGGGGSPGTNAGNGMGGSSIWGCGGGGCGGGTTDAAVFRGPGAGGQPGTLTQGGGGAPGTNGAAPTDGSPGADATSDHGAEGGGGGGATNTAAVNAGDGGDGGLGGGGGGGGGGCTGTGISGDGGDGGDGLLIIELWG